MLLFQHHFALFFLVQRMIYQPRRAFGCLLGLIYHKNLPLTGRLPLWAILPVRQQLRSWPRAAHRIAFRGRGVSRRDRLLEFCFQALHPSERLQQKQPR